MSDQRLKRLLPSNDRKQAIPLVKKKIITAQDAAKLAIEYYREVTGDYNQPSVEEVELSENGNNWLITLGLRRNVADTLASIYGKAEVVYKIFEINAHDGKVMSMKIRKV